MKKLVYLLKNQKFSLKKIPEKNTFSVEGEKGAITFSLNNLFGQHFINSKALFFPSKSYLRTFRSSILSSIFGVTQGFMLRLQLQGIGYRAKVYQDTNTLFLKTEGQILLTFQMPSSVIVKAKKQKIILFSLEKAALYDTMQRIKNLQRPNPYTGKGVRIFGEVVPLKVGKQRNR